ncbi:hypothetical protein ACIGO6_33870 [Streptomyces sp. NPDC053750]|uniref:hypothetical protein n=1 Tax=Streptomyces sp. NPDC053750 TaxID=3365714 RepID=UPI0037D12B4B
MELRQSGQGGVPSLETASRTWEMPWRPMAIRSGMRGFCAVLMPGSRRSARAGDQALRLGLRAVVSFAAVRAMMQTRPTYSDDSREYGLGLESRPLPCGSVYWGHGGDVFGYQTAGGATADGRQTTVMANVDPGNTDAQDEDIEAAVRTGLCEGRPARSR